MTAIAKKAYNKNLTIKNFIPEYANQAIHFTGEDMGGDRAMMIGLLYILIAIIAFIFSITIKHTIIRESSVIGTLRASGVYERRSFKTLPRGADYGHVNFFLTGKCTWIHYI